ncbi:MAG: Verru_Chthon cassette protein D [Verrucomicrobiales bacterium]|jgi:uncharacterized protein (TIGR02596 family)|nr:Verru_Chthon cassette protein D [bacterium]MDF2375689.1 Verru_Chthon cassette protein D [Verrucomicrobiales bacterium]
MKKTETGNKGFSLIELMVVLGLIGLLMAIAAPNMLGLITSNSLTGEGVFLENQLTLAQQTATAMSSDVEVRFFWTADENAAQTEPAYRAYQLYQYNERGKMEPISSLFRLRPPVVLSNVLSTLLTPGLSSDEQNRRFGFISPVEGEVEVPAIDNQKTKYVSFRFRPDGSTDLPSRSGEEADTWYLTVVSGEGAADATDLDNFVCIQVNPYNGKVTQYRP